MYTYTEYGKEEKEGNQSVQVDSRKHFFKSLPVLKTNQLYLQVTCRNF